MSTEKSTKVLILEHDPNDIELLEYELRKGGINVVTNVVDNGDAFQQVLSNDIPDIILSDYSLPSFNGIRAFQAAQEKCPGVPFIIVSGTIGEENAVELIKAGVTDYVLKDKLFTVAQKIKRALKEASERREKADAELNLRKSERSLAEAQVVAKIGSWETDAKGDLINCSDVMYSILGLQPGDFLTYQMFLGFVHPEDSNKVLDAQKKALSTGTIDPVTFRIISRQGQEKYIEARGALRSEEGASFIGTLQDITEKVHAEQQLKAYSEQIAGEREEHQRKLVRASIEGQEKERAEIGRELHDNINQILAVTKAYIDAAMTEAEDKREELLQRSLNNLDAAIQEIRRISKSLAPPTIDKNGLVDSVNDLIDSIRVVNPFAINFRYEKEKLTNLSTQQQLALYRIVQEQFNNIIKHAEATRVQVELTGNNNLINLMIQDNGKGFDPKAKRAGVGLSNILSRIELFDGKLEVIAAKGSGCTLKVLLPKEGA